MQYTRCQHAPNSPRVAWHSIHAAGSEPILVHLYLVTYLSSTCSWFSRLIYTEEHLTLLPSHLSLPPSFPLPFLYPSPPYVSPSILRHVIGEKKISDTFFRSTIFPSYGSGDAVSPLAGSGAEPRKQTHIGNNLLKIVVLLYNFIIIYLYNIGAQNSWFFLEVT